MSGESGFSIASPASTEPASRPRGERPRPAERDVASFERALHGRDPQARAREERAADGQAEQDLDRKRLQARTDGAAYLSAPHLLAAAANLEPQAAAQAAASWDDLFAQYVQTLAVSEPGKPGDARLLLRLDPSLLPQTELWLTRAPEGWVLQAHTTSPDAYRTLTEFGPALERRFALRGLGPLSVQTTLQPTAVQGLT